MDLGEYLPRFSKSERTIIKYCKIIIIYLFIFIFLCGLPSLHDKGTRCQLSDLHHAPCAWNYLAHIPVVLLHCQDIS